MPKVESEKEEGDGGGSAISTMLVPLLRYNDESFRQKRRVVTVSTATKGTRSEVVLPPPHYNKCLASDMTTCATMTRAISTKIIGLS